MSIIVLSLSNAFDEGSKGTAVTCVVAWAKNLAPLTTNDNDVAFGVTGDLHVNEL